MSEDGESDIVVVAPPAGSDGSYTEGMSNHESEGQMPEEVASLMETVHRELEEPNNLESKRTLGKKGKKNIQFAVRHKKSVRLIL